MNKKSILIALLAFFTISGMAQTEESDSSQVDWKWTIGGVPTLLAPEPDYYDKNCIRYNPPISLFWFGSSWLNGGMMGDRHAKFHLRSGVFNKIDVGFTILQFSRNLYRGILGVSFGLQFGATMYNISREYDAVKNGYRVNITSSEGNQTEDDLSFATMRIPLLIGAQTNNRLFSLQTGLGLCYTSRFGAQWLVTAGLGPVTINYSQNLTPLFKLGDGTKAYPSSLTVGFDLWYYLCRFTHPKD